MRNRRRERANDDDDDEGPNFHRIQVRAVEGGRRFARMLLPRPPRETAGAAAAAPLINNEAAAAPMSVDDAPLEGRRVVRALRPFARAAQMREVINLADDSDEDTAMCYFNAQCVCASIPNEEDGTNRIMMLCGAEQKSIYYHFNP